MTEKLLGAFTKEDLEWVAETQEIIEQLETPEDLVEYLQFIYPRIEALSDKYTQGAIAIARIQLNMGAKASKHGNQVLRKSH